MKLIVPSNHDMMPQYYQLLSLTKRILKSTAVGSHSPSRSVSNALSTPRATSSLLFSSALPLPLPSPCPRPTLRPRSASGLISISIISPSSPSSPSRSSYSAKNSRTSLMSVSMRTSSHISDRLAGSTRISPGTVGAQRRPRRTAVYPAKKVSSGD